MHSPWFARVGVAALLVPCALSCAMMSQSRKGQELSYRGAWQCAQRGCAPSTMVQSRRGSNQDGVRFNEVSFNPRAAMAFTAASPFDRLEASVRDCKGAEAPITAEDAIKKPGEHDVGDASARESWIVIVDPRAHSGLDFTGCGRWVVKATATWAADKRTFTLEAGLSTPKK
ncbi:MAG: hypothetical protein H6713_05955 [Myxococcales bacterium]|nr:hypothetical protein [Myxococcales bacterium]